MKYLQFALVGMRCQYIVGKMKLENIKYLIVFTLVLCVTYYGINVLSKNTDDNGGPTPYNGSVKTFDYNGHSYIQFGVRQSKWGLHDPDCKCHEKENP